MTMRNKRLFGILIAAAFLLSIPLVAMQFTDDVKWSAFDFILAGVLLLGTGLVCEVALRVIRKPQHRIAVCAAILAALVLVFIELAVGLFGTPFAGS